MGGGSGGGSSGEDYIEDKDAKHLLDSIGKIVHKKVHSEAQTYDSYLKGNLNKANNASDETISSLDPCELVNKYISKVGAARGDPCGNGSASEKRFSKESGGECDDKKIEGNKNNSEGGACAPYRRLYLCNKNMVKMDTNNNDSSKAKHKLLAEVCMAANYEAQSLITYHDQYDSKYPGSDFSMCTMLARSFADIGDIVRGRDLYRGNKKKNQNGKETERDKLENKLKTIFGKIHSEVTNVKTLKDRYKGDREKNYYELREDWWTANRHTVWEAMTCSEQLKGNKYFRATCNISSDNEKTGTLTPSQCRCDDKPNTDPPTYFDYVPQYLRWFEEWAEDFCRKKKKKLEKLEQQCRGPSGNQRYCSRNGYDCEQTVNARGKVRMGKGCTDCFFACNPYVDWIEKQKEQFDKQVKKYKTEISGGGASGGRSGNGRKKRGATTKVYDGYEKIFYNKLKESSYNGVNSFLDLLSNEDVCKKITDEKEGTINFKEVNSGGTAGTSGGTSGTSGTNDEKKGTFYRSKYCQPCPLCGMKKKDDGSGWEEKNNGMCKSGNLYRPKGDEVGTPINFLYSGDRQAEIEKKLEAFCQTQIRSDGSGVASGDKNGGSDSQKLYQNWQCYQLDQLDKVGEGVEDEDYLEYDLWVKNGGGLCILKKKKEEGEAKSQNNHADIQKTYNDFFNFWVAHMLKDSIYWRTKKLDKCINNTNKSKACKNNEKCNKECGCFQKWVEHKQQEWDAIKKHFKTQDIRGTVGNGNTVVFFFLDHDAVLEGVLEKGVLLTSIKEGYGNEKDIEHIKQLLEDEENVFDDSKKKNTIDKLIDHEKKIAENCLKTHKENCQQQENTGGARAGQPLSPGPKKNEPDSKEHEDEDDDEDDENEEEAPEDAKVDAEGEKQEVGSEPEEGPTATPPEVNPCEIVNTLFTSDDSTALQDACRQKYGPGGKEKFPNWKCISDSTTKPGADGTPSGSSDKGSICVPPRRRKLYIQKLHDWAKKQTQLQTQAEGTSVQAAQGSDTADSAASSTSSPTDATHLLRQAFIQSAAIETFFAWHKYKAENTKSKDTQGVAIGLVPSLNGDSEDDKNNPEKMLQSGNIPPDFLRQMFYTLGDYRDILFGDKEVIEVLKAGGIDITTINDKIKDILEKSGNQQPDKQNSGTTPSSWWENNAKHIWEGMICALTYKENGADGTNKIEKDSDVYNKFFGTPNGKPGPQPGTAATPNGTYKEKYDYEKVTINSVGPNGDSTSLLNFARRPPFFRWLEEWGEEFCKKRTDKLEKVKDKCQGYNDGGNKIYCSGDGHDCTENGNLRHRNMFANLDCRPCYKQCRKYRKWIDIKFVEYQNQKSKYQEELQKLNGNSNNGDDDNKKYYQELKQKKNTSAKFLAALKHCKNDQNSENKGNQEDQLNKLDFTNIPQTFSRSTYCETCPLNGVTCNGSRRAKNGECTPDNGNGKTWDTVFKQISGNSENSTITVDMIDRRAPFIEEYLKNSKTSQKSKDSFKTSRLFKGLTVQNWKCKFKDKNTDVCKLDKFDPEIDLNEYTTFKVLLIYWLEDFIEGYYILKQKKIIEKCTKNGKNTCDKEPKNDCACVKEWVDKKKNEWGKIKDNFNNRKEKEGDDDMKSSVKMFLEDLQHLTELKKIMQPCTTLDKFKESLKCNGSNPSEKEDINKKDTVDCMIKDLETKIGECASQHSGEETETACQKSPAPFEDDDEEDLLLQETEEKPDEAKKNMMPKICEKVVQTEPAKEEPDGTCDGADTSGAKKAEEEGAPAQEPAADSGKETLVPKTPEAKKDKTKKKLPKPQPPRDDPWEPLKPALISSTLMWTVGIGFAAFTYFYLKKKTKSSVGNLFQILHIPKSDYNIPTKLSPNRYIPYTSGKYRGKRYIYLEGDSGTDSGYTDHYSDITSSSESEYEELDINDIYVPGSPKYKTLIEVVLEPSGKLSGNTIPTSGKNTPSDTQNDIQNDGIPSSKITDNEWNTLKDEFISNMLQNQPNDVPNDYSSGNVTLNTQPNTLYIDKPQEKPFIMSIHDRDLYSGEEYNYNVNMVNNDDIPINRDNNVYSGIDLINDTLSGNQHIDIYDELLKRKENELFGTNYKKNTSKNSVAKNTNSDPIHNQLELFHKWLDRHRNMCEKWENHHERLAKLKEEWENETHSGNTHPSDSNKTLNTDVSIQIHMDNPKPINEFTNMDTYPNNSSMDTILEDLDKPFNEPYYYDMYDDDIYYDVNDHDTSTADSNNMDVPSKVQIEMDVNNKLVKEKYPIADVWDI
ncbi:erythrocyte membrane protein 1 [Plasmodium falciparum IGH-CR14]|uniref:Erythrocyte membrane protein 1 n=1 Tax=Plasmodium falciparum IGH-CR14 TaxID=580059 RepID=A0A0L1I8E1_PLAFA|nr:erythrocyte membrane protein 1 [Plasmodium falciparum IGH-CR14]